MPPRHVTLAFDTWPAGDRAAWLALYAEAGLFDEGGSAIHQRPATREMMQDSYGRWLMWLKQEGVLHEDEGPAARITPDRVRAFIGSMEESLSPGTIAVAIQHLDQLANWFAPENDWRWLRRWKQKLWRRYRPPGKQDKLVSAHVLSDLGLALMDEMRGSMEVYPIKWLTRYRDGLMIALLIHCPFRLGNFTAIRIGEHLLRAGDGYRVVFRTDETKTHVREVKPVPDVLVPYLNYYLEEVRPALMNGRDTDALWVTKNGDPMPHWSVAKQIKHWTRKRLGRAISPHLFRHCAATEAARMAGDNSHLAREVLGHASLQTTERHYIMPDQAHAAARYQDLLRSFAVQAHHHD